jgi:hypothetical protein
MSAQRRRLERLVALQQKLKAIEDIRHQRAALREAELRARRQSLIEMLNSDDPFHGMFLEPLSNRLRATALDLETEERRRAAAAESALRQARRTRTAERLLDGTRRALDAEAERRGLGSVIEQSLRRLWARLP